MFKWIKPALVLLLIITPFSAAHAEAYCATVKIEIAQELSLERQAFDAVMKINNGLDTLSIEDVNIDVYFTNENGDPVLATNDPNDSDPDVKFFLRVDSMTGINAVDGSGIVDPASTAEIRWLIIPVPGAAAGQPGGKLFFVGANLTYTFGGQAEEVDVVPDFITVMPLPQLALDYFLTEEVIGDDAFTPEVEAPEPYTLGVRIKNNGTGDARDIKIDSAQPKIVENDQEVDGNEQGLLLDFAITGSSLNDQPAQPTLLIDFGTISSGEATVGRWIMETSLSGKFTEFTANVTHADELGGAVTSIIDSNDVNTHFLLRDVLNDLPGRDAVRDFLARPAGAGAEVLKLYESDSVDTDVDVVSSSASFSQNSSSGSEVVYDLSIPVAAGLSYARITDPFSGQKVITSALRSDGKTILLDNVWTSKTRNRDTSPPTWEYWVNIFDSSTTGSYSVVMDDMVIGPQAPVIQVITDKETFENNQVGFVVEASDPNGDAVALSALPLPAGATFIDNGNGTAFFNWTPSIGQTGTYLIVYKATDGVLTSQRTSSIRVNSASDTDGDGLDDAWEMEHFGDLGRDGDGDFDNDGISDLDEFIDGTDPDLLPPSAPGDLLGISGNSQASFNWSAVSGATSYNLYWSETPGLSKESGFAIEDAVSTFTHVGLTNDSTYYYAIASRGAGGESELSAEIEVTPGNKNWGVPGAVENSTYDILEYQIAYAGNGTAMALWSENDTVAQRINLWASLYTAGSGWGTEQLIEASDTADVESISVQLDSFGNAVAVWRQVDGATDSLWSNSYDVAGSWGTALQIASANAGELGQAEVVLTDSGAAMLGWLQASPGETWKSQVWSSLLYANAAEWTTAARVESTIGAEVSGLQFADGGSGNVIAVWSQTLDAGSSYDLVSNQFSGSQWVGESIIRSAMYGDARSPVITADLAVNQLGDALLVWTELSTVNSVWVMEYDIANGWGLASLVEFDDVNPAYDPDVALSDNGEGIVVWTQSNGIQDVIYANRYHPAMGWDASTAIVSSTATGDPVGTTSMAKTAIDASGNIVVVWQQLDSVQSNVWSNRYDSLNGWDGPIIIDYENNGDAINPVIAMDDAGNTLSVWEYSDGTNTDLLFNDLTAQNTGMPNILPVVVIPDSLVVEENAMVEIDGSNSFEQDGYIALYEWSQVSGSTVSLSGLYTHTMSFVAPSLGVAETLVFRLTATDGDNAVGTAEVSVVVNPRVNTEPVGLPSIDGIATQGETLSANTTGISDADGLGVFSYQWQADGVDIAGANAVSHTLTQGEVGTQITVVVSYTDGGGTGESLSSAEVGPVVNINDAPVGLP
ncbi:MAG: hypothetical protein GY820_01390, partial [Gammaproteobacteria bacterium]|nr:hypothetical protein [Gammaproteobacteria bacterium]